VRGILEEDKFVAFIRYFSSFLLMWVGIRVIWPFKGREALEVPLRDEGFGPP
jgi:hypothetical protein